ncbi:Hypothetical_protein [Hexamita inflata]|uniref:Hypothetical_protein n=1 Tax=Hexamita inflata TaxID=28002 RepID=A0AA86Q192_9EUKA|nr:Hypothetical protein HINF_LOCUS35487 [Hexamita inflata]
MLNFIFLSVLQLDSGSKCSCKNGFTIQDSQCKCLFFQSSNGTLCVKNCSEINEIEVNGACSSIKSKNNIDCSLFGIGFVSDGAECTCLSDSDCFCTSEECCQKSGLHYFGPELSCNSCENIYGTGYVWQPSGEKFCKCPKNTQCTCKSQFCCPNENKVLIKGECQQCTAGTFIVNTDMQIAYCGCSNEKNEYGSIQKLSDTCTQCPELLNKDKNGCVTCEQAYGTGYVMIGNSCKCPSGVLCECKTDQCCQKLGLKLINGVCKSCNDIYQISNAVFDENRNCKCDNLHLYAGTLNQLGDTCSLCSEYANSQGTACQTCENNYGTGYFWNTDNYQCWRQQGNNEDTCTSNSCCVEEWDKVFVSQRCQSCSEAYGLGAILNLTLQSCVCDSKNNYYGLDQVSSVCQFCEGIVNKLTQTCTLCLQLGTGYIWDSNTKKCICSGKCKCTSETCCQLYSTHYINNKCGKCYDNFGPGYYWDRKSNRCQCINEFQCECTTDFCCSSSFTNSHINILSKQCDCNKGYKFNNGQCQKSSSKVIGFAVGIPFGFVFLLLISLIIIIILKKKHMKNKVNDEESKETVQVATETDQITQPVIDTIPENDQNYIPVLITQ